MLFEIRKVLIVQSGKILGTGTCAIYYYDVNLICIIEPFHYLKELPSKEFDRKLTREINYVMS